ncbi:MAG: hypothetical protein AB4372_26670 [Xenococcus sp. (in: cyanobacteria)]
MSNVNHIEFPEKPKAKEYIANSVWDVDAMYKDIAGDHCLVGEIKSLKIDNYYFVPSVWVKTKGDNINHIYAIECSMVDDVFMIEVTEDVYNFDYSKIANNLYHWISIEMKKYHDNYYVEFCCLEAYAIDSGGHWEFCQLVNKVLDYFVAIKGVYSLCILDVERFHDVCSIFARKRRNKKQRYKVVGNK